MATNPATGTQDYPWYRVVTEVSLEQGDFLTDLPILIPPPFNELSAEDSIGVRLREFNMVILTQSCGLSAGKVDNVMVAPVFKTEDMEEAVSELKSKGGKNKVKQGAIPSVHMLPPCELPGFESPPRVVNFRQAAAVPLDWIVANVSADAPRLRLMPPYREHLAQAFARFIMRVGFPHDYQVE